MLFIELDGLEGLNFSPFHFSRIFLNLFLYVIKFNFLSSLFLISERKVNTQDLIYWFNMKNMVFWHNNNNNNNNNNSYYYY